jgi:hypothetical protein
MATWLALVSEHAAALAQEPASGLRYELELELDPVRHVLQGSERIHFENHARTALPALYFHLYMNAFRDTHSVFMREGGAQLRNGKLSRAGSCEVTRMQSADGRDLLAHAEHELVPHDYTQLRVPLAQPLQPGAALDLTVEFRVQLPEIVARSGYAGSFHMLGQFYPKLARLEDDGFVSFPYHGLGEFYADFADYVWQVRVPARYRIASSGERVSSVVQDGERREHFVAKRVHDIAWAAFPYFDPLQTRISSIALSVYAPPGYRAAQERQAHVLAAAVRYFETRYGSYPYPHLTVIIPPAEASRAAGMEYPTLFTSAGAFWALPNWLPDLGHDLVSVHELAHQWFSGMLASDEVRYPLLDEGLAEWASLDFLRVYYAQPPNLFARLRPPFGVFDLLRALFLWRGQTTPSSLLAATSYNFNTLGPAVYMRPALTFEAIAQRYGRDKLDAALMRYSREQRFHHPVPADLFAAFDSSFGAGFAARVLEPALDGKTPSVLDPTRSRVSDARSTGWSFFAELAYLAQSFVQELGP